VLGAMSGAVWLVRAENSWWSGAGIYVGHTKAAERFLPPLEAAKDILAPTADEVGPDGFRIRTVVGNRIFIEGATPEATPYAVSWLLQRYAGVRWYTPGPLGEVIPRRTEWTLPECRSCASRRTSRARSPGCAVPKAGSGRDATGCGSGWSTATTSRRSHAGVYDAHPEWFGAVHGQRRRPLGGGEYRWQPDLSRG
jgi:hypothetical protein